MAGALGARPPRLNRSVRRTKSPVDFATMTDADDDNHQLGIVDSIKDAIVALAYPVEVVTRKFLASGRPRVLG